MQLLFESSEEHGHQEGLGLIPGTVRRLDPGGDSHYRVPNIGWCDVLPTRPSLLFPKALPICCYFVHSYHVAPLGPRSFPAPSRSPDGPLRLRLNRTIYLVCSFIRRKAKTTVSRF